MSKRTSFRIYLLLITGVFIVLSSSIESESDIEVEYENNLEINGTLSVAVGATLNLHP